MTWQTSPKQTYAEMKAKHSVAFRAQAAMPCRILIQEQAHKVITCTWLQHPQLKQASMSGQELKRWSCISQTCTIITISASAPYLRNWCFHRLLKLLLLLSLTAIGHTLVHSYHVHLFHTKQLHFPLDSSLCFLQAASSFQKGWQ